MLLIGGLFLAGGSIGLPRDSVASTLVFRRTRVEASTMRRREHGRQEPIEQSHHPNQESKRAGARLLQR